ncbi:MAG: DoxX family protein [Acidobacteriota bacterium]
MDGFLGKFSPRIYAILRVVVGLLFACHGAQKLFGILGGFGGEAGATAPLFSLMGAAGVIEFFGGLLIALGFLAGWVAFIASGEMAAAYFMAHAPQGLIPVLNRGETAVLYCFVFLYIASQGAGIWSIDGALGKSKSAT